jgi:hypothetical protein
MSIFTETNYVLKPNLYRIFVETQIKIKNLFFIKTDFTTSLKCVYLGSIFLGIRLIVCSTIFDLLLWGT